MEEKRRKLRLSDAWRDARDIIWPRRYRLLFGLVFMLVNRLSGLVLPALSKTLVDDVLTQKRSDLLPWLAVAAGLSTAFQALTTFLLAQVLGIAAQRSITELRKSVQEHVTRLPISFFDSTKSGVLISRVMNDAEGIRNLVGTGLVQLTGGAVTAILAVCVLFYINWHLTLIMFGVMIVFGFIMAYTFKKVRPIFRERNKIYGEVTGRLAETFGGVRVVKAYVAEKHEERVFAEGSHLLFRNIARSMTAISGVTALTNLIFGAVAVIMMTIGGRAILSGAMSLGDFVMYILFTGMVAAPMIQIASIGTQLTEAFAGLDRIREVKRLATEDAEDPSLAPLESVFGDVEFNDVSFEYNPGTPVLKHVTFKAPAGATTALVGSSGSGKSTLISLVMAFNRPTTGRVIIDGRDLGTVRLRDYRSHLGVVLQDNFLFDGTVADNIRYSRPHATRDEIVAVAKIAHADEFIERFDEKYETVVGERGVKLSGGQRQRIAIARAILADPRILILDEATSSLDSESEALIQDGLNRLRKGRTTFVIAHRLSTIRSADQILVLEGGEIVESGTHEQLLAVDGRYRQLYEKQYRFERDRFINPGEDFTPEPAALGTAPKGPGQPNSL